MSGDRRYRQVLLVGDEDSGRQTLLFPLVTGLAYVPGHPARLPQYRRTTYTADGRSLELDFMVSSSLRLRYRVLEYARANAILLCFAVDDQRGFLKAVRGHWIKELKTNIDRHVPIILVANKVDMRPRQASDDEGQASESSSSSSSEPTSESSDDGDDSPSSGSSDEDRGFVTPDEGRDSDSDELVNQSLRRPGCRFVSTEQALTGYHAERRFSAFFECSAYTMEGVNQLLASLAEAVVE